MFSGIVEAMGRVVHVESAGDNLRIAVEIPLDWTDLSAGDSVAHDGVCLTVEKLEENRAWYSLGLETLRITGWGADILGREFNLERSLRLGDRVHGHIVLGHVDGTVEVKRRELMEGFLRLTMNLPEQFKRFLWPKGSVALNGVSLTINLVGDDFFEVGLIPETLERTNLSQLREGDQIQLELDNMARALVRTMDLNEGRRAIDSPSPERELSQ